MIGTLKLAAVSLAAAAILTPTITSAQWTSGRHSPYAAHGYGRGDDRPIDERRTERVHCDRGNGGTLLGAIAGGLLGNAIVGRHGDRTAGTIGGAGAGALLGRAADRDC